MPFRAERVDRHERNPNVAQAAVRVKSAETAARRVTAVHTKVCVHVVAAAISDGRADRQRQREGHRLEISRRRANQIAAVLVPDITTLGKNAGLEFKAFRPKAEIRRGFYSEVPIDIEFSGDFHEIATFLDRVAKLPRIVNVRKLEMSVKKESIARTTLRVTGRATTFRFIEGGGAT